MTTVRGAGVVTIEAASLRDAAFGLGFAHGQDRFFQMDLSRRLAAGELAALFGAAALSQDELARPFGFRAIARRELAAAAPAERAWVEAYAAGVNAGLGSLRARPWEYWLLRARPAEWRAEDTLLLRNLREFRPQDHADVVSFVMRFQQITGLFIGGTAPLVDAIADCSDATTHDFETGDGVLAYLRAHGLVPEETESLDERAGIQVGEDFLVAHRIALGPLLDLFAAFLDALELHFDLYEIEIEPAEETATAPAVPAEAA